MASQTCYPPETAATQDILLSADTKYRNRDYLGALSEYSRAIEIDPSNATLYCCRGVAYYRLGDKQNAFTDYNCAIELDPKLAMGYYRRGFLHYIAKDYSSAIADYNKAIDCQPDFALAYSNRGYAYRELYGEQEAILDWRFAAKLFKEQGKMDKYQSMMLLIEKCTGADSCASGMLW
jgi:Flp pilus assembly protein TadD